MDTQDLPTAPDADEALRRTRNWLRAVVVGLDLCPFARGPVETGRVRFAVSEGRDLESVLVDLWLELDRLVAAEASVVETTILIVPHALASFDDFLDAIAIADGILESRGYEGVLQIAHFHPDYQFEGSTPDDPANYTNRSPYPLFHLLREDSVSRAVDAHPDIDGVPDRNADLMRRLDPKQLAAWRRGDEPGEPDEPC